MIDFTKLYDSLGSTSLSPYVHSLPGAVQHALEPSRDSRLETWLHTLAQLPDIHASRMDFNHDCIQIGAPDDCDAETRNRLEQCLRELIPWRKGPFNLFGIHIDTEWHSDWKWQRLSTHIASLQDRTILDVGCGNGYYSLRMLGAGAKRVIGIDTSLLFLAQFQALRKYTGEINADVIPLGIEDFRPMIPVFDSVFSMGVIYHRRDPLQHLKDLAGFVREGGELVLETLVIDGELGEQLIPEERYAMMRNVWSVPSCALLQRWAQEAGFDRIRIVDVTVTSTEEQRSTPWMPFQSLPDFLDPRDPSKTVEGYPAPKRAILIASKP